MWLSPVLLAWHHIATRMSWDLTCAFAMTRRRSLPQFRRHWHIHLFYGVVLSQFIFFCVWVMQMLLHLVHFAQRLRVNVIKNRLEVFHEPIFCFYGRVRAIKALHGVGCFVSLRNCSKLTRNSRKKTRLKSWKHCVWKSLKCRASGAPFDKLQMNLWHFVECCKC